jgi:hypothetical protein
VPLALVALLWGAAPALAVEGSTAAGPIGGTDVRSAFLPPPGVYGGMIGVGGDAPLIVDAHGHVPAGLGAAHLTVKAVAPFLIYVPDVKVLGGSIGAIAVAPYGAFCGRLFEFQPWRCAWGAGDPYVEVAWSRYFGTPRASKVPGSFPIPEGLAVSFGLGAVLPVGQYNVQMATEQGIRMGNNILDVAPSFAFTYTTPPIIAEGTEISAKTYWNNYRTNPATQYKTADLINIDFAVTERYGRFQLGVTGFYAWQTGNDKINGVTIPPDGRKGEAFVLGGILVHDMPEYGASVKVKAVTTVYSENAVRQVSGIVGFIKKLD